MARFDKSRRAFGLGLPLGALSLLGRETPPETPPHPSPAMPPPLLVRTLGRTGLKVPVVSMGVMNASAHALVARSYERGIRLFDTAWYYQRGMNEQMVGDTVQRLSCRDEVLIATKIFLKEKERDLYTPSIKALFLERFEESLKRLQTSYVDILYYHAAGEVREMNNPPILQAFEELKKAGRVRFCGVSFHGDQAAMLDDMRRSRFFDVALVLFNAALGHPGIAGGKPERLVTAMEAAAADGIGLIAMKTQCGGGGSWGAKLGGGTVGELDHSALLKWVLRHPFITTAVPGYTSFEQMEEDIAAGRDLEYTSDERAFLEREQLRVARSFCIQCGSCLAQCQRGVDIPTLMRTYMYAFGYGNLELALTTQAALPRARGLRSCADCAECIVRCPRQIDVGQRLTAVRDLLERA